MQITYTDVSISPVLLISTAIMETVNMNRALIEDAPNPVIRTYRKTIIKDITAAALMPIGVLLRSLNIVIHHTFSNLKIY